MPQVPWLTSKSFGSASRIVFVPGTLGANLGHPSCLIWAPLALEISSRYSFLNVSIGSTLAARRAGMDAANIASSSNPFEIASLYNWGLRW